MKDDIRKDVSVSTLRFYHYRYEKTDLKVDQILNLSSSLHNFNEAGYSALEKSSADMASITRKA